MDSTDAEGCISLDGASSSAGERHAGPPAAETDTESGTDRQAPPLAPSLPWVTCEITVLSSLSMGANGGSDKGLR